MTDIDRPSFLGLTEDWRKPADVVIMQIPFEMTVSYGSGTAKGPSSVIEASRQVETYSELIGEDLPAGLNLRTIDPWNFEGPNLMSFLDSINSYVFSNVTESTFPIVLGGEHGILLPVLRGFTRLGKYSMKDLTLIQIDAHADLRDELNGESYSHGTVIRRCLDSGLGKVIQIGVRAYSNEEVKMMEEDSRIQYWTARRVSESETVKKEILRHISKIKGPVWISLDIDAFDPGIVPGTGTIVPGGLDYWFVVKIIEEIFTGSGEVVGSDISEIVPDHYGITQFTSASLAAVVLASYVAQIRSGV